MHQICDGYNPRVRMGNWLEESYSVSQQVRDHPIKKARQSQIDIGYIDAHLKLRPLNRMARLPHWNTSGLVEAPQYKDYYNNTNAKDSYDLSTTQHYFRKWKPNVLDKCNGSNVSAEPYIKINQFKKEHKMFNDQTVEELLNNRVSDMSSFKSQIVPNKHLSQKQLLQTVYQTDFSKFKDKQSHKQNQTDNGQQRKDFRRIRSEITLHNLPNIITYK